MFNKVETSKSLPTFSGLGFEALIKVVQNDSSFILALELVHFHSMKMSRFIGSKGK